MQSKWVRPQEGVSQLRGHHDKTRSRTSQHREQSRHKMKGHWAHQESESMQYRNAPWIFHCHLEAKHSNHSERRRHFERDRWDHAVFQDEGAFHPLSPCLPTLPFLPFENACHMHQTLMLVSKGDDRARCWGIAMHHEVQKAVTISAVFSQSSRSNHIHEGRALVEGDEERTNAERIRKKAFGLREAEPMFLNPCPLPLMHAVVRYAVVLKIKVVPWIHPSTPWLGCTDEKMRKSDPRREWRCRTPMLKKNVSECP